MVEIGQELSLSNERRQIAMGAREQAHIDFLRLVGALGIDYPVLGYAQ